MKSFQIIMNYLLKFLNIPTWPANHDLTNSTDAGTFAITDTKLYALLVTLSTQNNAKLLQQVKSGLERPINWNKYQSKVTIQGQNQYLDKIFRE